MKKRIVIFIFSFLFLFSQSAMAILPLLAAGARIVSAGLKTSAGQDLAIGSALGVGLIIAQLNWQRQGTDGSGKTDTLYYTNTPRPPTALEAAEGFTAGSPSLTPQATRTAGTMWKGIDSIGSFSTGDAAARDYITRVYTQWHTDSTNVSPSNSTYWIAHITANNNAGLHQDVSAALSYVACPAGYTASGNNCNLSNAAAVSRPVDGFCPITRTGATYAVDPSDPDCSNGAPPSFAADGTFSIASADGTSVSSAPTGVAGQRKITYSYPDLTKNTTKTRQILIDNSGDITSAPTVQGVIDSEVQGIGAAVTTTPVAPSSTVNVDVSPVVAAVNAAAAARAADVAAKEAAAVAAAAAIPAIPANPATVPGLNLPNSNPFSSLMPFSGINLPSNNGSCVGLNVSLPHMGSMNLMPCDMVDAVRPMVNFLIVALGVIGGVLVWLRPEGDA